MRYLGIDYGSKRVGVALSDESATFAMPHGVIGNTSHLIEDLNDIICNNQVGVIILGESKDYKGKENTIMEKTHAFKKELEGRFQIPVLFEPEFLTSHQAVQFQGKNELLDASAASLILQSYLDRLKNTNSTNSQTHD